jgi:hypothetical protein
VAEVLDAYSRYHERGRLAGFLPKLQPERMDTLRAVRAKLDGADSQQVPGLLRELGIEARVGDARALPDDAGSIDCFVSNTTLEHIPPDVLRGIFAEFRRVGADNAVMSHYIDLSDHYSHFDGRITPYHFLRYSPGRWRWYNNTLQYQNRLRVSDYRAIHAETGFEVVHEADGAGSPEQIGRIVLAPEFERYEQDDLVVINSWMVSVPRTD